MPVTLESLKDTTKSQRRKIIVSVVVVSVIVHLLGGIVATIWIVARYLAPPEATFVAKKMVAIPPKIIDPKMAAAELEAAAPKPVLDQQLASLRATDFALPDVPRMDVDQVVKFDPSTMVSDQMTGMLAGTGGGGGAGNGGSDGEGSAMNFFGIKDKGRAVIIMVDVSDTMFERQRRGVIHKFDFKDIKGEAGKLIDGLSIASLFNVVIYEGGSLAYSAEMLPASDGNKAEAKRWVDGLEEDPNMTIGRRRGGPKLMEGGGTRLDTAMKQALRMKPDVIFLITDGEMGRNSGWGGDRDKESDNKDKDKKGADSDYGEISEKEILEIIEEEQKKLPAPARIHVIQYVTSIVRPEEQSKLKAIARKNKGRFEEIEAEEVK